MLGRMATSLDLRPLREREFRLFFVGQVVSVIGDGLVWVALPFAVLELGGGPAAVGLVFGASALSLAVFAVIGGVLADRLPRRGVMLAADAVRLVVQALAGGLILAGAAEIWMLAVLQLVYGAGEALFRPASTGLVPATVPADLLQPANALIGLTRSVGTVVGPALGGGLVVLAGPGGAFLFDAATFAISAAFLVRLTVARTGALGEPATFLGDLVGGYREVRAHSWLWFMIALTSLWLFLAIAPFQALGPIVADTSLGGAGAWGAILAAYGLGGIAGGVIALAVRPRYPLRVIAVLFFLEVPAVGLLAATAPLWAIVAAAVAGGLSFGLFEALWTTTLQERIPDESISRVSSFDWMGSLALLPLGYALAGPAASALGVGVVLWIATGASVAFAVALCAHRGVWRLERLGA